jgi:hypothetical protein
MERVIEPLRERVPQGERSDGRQNRVCVAAESRTDHHGGSSYLSPRPEAAPDLLNLGIVGELQGRRGWGSLM